MKEEYKNLPYRDNVGIVVMRGDKFLLVQLNEWSDKFWKFPQGGCDVGEEPEKTALREFEEELGSKSIKIRHKSQFQNVYDFSDEKIEVTGKRWRGQRQTFFVAEFVGENDELVPDPKEIRAFRWCSREELKDYIFHEDAIFLGYYDFILKVLDEFGL